MKFFQVTHPDITFDNFADAWHHAFVNLDIDEPDIRDDEGLGYKVKVTMTQSSDRFYVAGYNTDLGTPIFSDINGDIQDAGMWSIFFDDDGQEWTVNDDMQWEHKSD